MYVDTVWRGSPTWRQIYTADTAVDFDTSTRRGMCFICHTVESCLCCRTLKLLFGFKENLSLPLNCKELWIKSSIKTLRTPAFLIIHSEWLQLFLSLVIVASELLQTFRGAHFVDEGDVVESDAAASCCQQILHALFPRKVRLCWPSGIQTEHWRWHILATGKLWEIVTHDCCTCSESTYCMLPVMAELQKFWCFLIMTFVFATYSPEMHIVMARRKKPSKGTYIFALEAGSCVKFPLCTKAFCHFSQRLI